MSATSLESRQSNRSVAPQNIHGTANENEGCSRSSRQPAVLLVDGEPLVRTMVGRALRARGVTVWTAVDGQHAWELCQCHSDEIDLVFLDMRMPALDGKHALAALHAVAPDAGICLLSWRMDACVKKHLLESGVTHVFDKPIRLAELVQVVERLLATGRANSSGNSRGCSASPAGGEASMRRPWFGGCNRESPHYGCLGADREVTSKCSTTQWAMAHHEHERNVQLQP
jgi:CheY-like chemotaxis protein